MSTHSAGRRTAVKTGCKPVHFSLDGCPLSCYFSGSVATTSGHFVHKSERRTKNGGVYIRPVCYSTGSVKGDSEVGGVCGRNNDPITACYCTNSSLSEISYNSGNATKVEEVNGTSSL